MKASVNVLSNVVETEDGRKFRQNRVPLAVKAKSSTHNRSASILQFPELSSTLLLLGILRYHDSDQYRSISRTVSLDEVPRGR